jgi:hypothetical protein
LDEWLRSQSEVATFFLDSIDELKLTLGKFDQALKRLNKSLAGQLGRVRVVITTRPVLVDRALIEQYLPIPSASEAEPTAEAFADAVMDSKKKPDNAPKTKAWRNVGLMPLSTAQMRKFAVAQNVSDPDALLEDIRLRDAEEFAQRPQDLIELCSDWREHHRIRTHRNEYRDEAQAKHGAKRTGTAVAGESDGGCKPSCFGGDAYENAYAAAQCGVRFRGSERSRARRIQNSVRPKCRRKGHVT